MKIHRGNFKSNKLFLKKLKKMGILKYNHTILEIGSGHGAMVNFLRNKGYNILGTEINDEHIQSAQKLFDVKLIKIKKEGYPFGKNRFDIIMSFDVFEHIPNSGKHLQEVNRVLKNNGYYLFQTPNKLTSTLASIIQNKNLTKHKKSHCSLQTKRSLKKLLRKYGFKYEFIKINLLTPFMISKIYRIFGKGLGKIIVSLNLPNLLNSNYYIIAQKEKDGL